MIYFLQAADGGPVKIGYTGRHVDDRLPELQTGSPFPLRVLLTIEGGVPREKELHRRFWHLHSHGEWFKPGRDLTAFIADGGHLPFTGIPQLDPAFDGSFEWARARIREGKVRLGPLDEVCQIVLDTLDYPSSDVEAAQNARRRGLQIDKKAARAALNKLVSRGRVVENWPKWPHPRIWTRVP